MELDLNVEKIDYMKLLFSGSLVHEETAEVIVPDILPDACRIVTTCGTALLRGKDVSERGLTVAGTVEGAVLYLPEEEDIARKIDFSVPFEATLATEDSLPPECRLTACVSVRQLWTDILNPRKVCIRMAVAVSAKAYGQETAEIAVPAAEGGDVELREKTVTAEIPSAVCEKTFTLSDELTFPNGMPEPGEILSILPQLTVDEVKGVGNKLVARGRLVTNVIYLSADGQIPASGSFTTPFSQIIECDVDCEDNVSDVTPMLIGVYLSRGGATTEGALLMLEADAVLQCVTYAKKEIRCIEDAYSTGYDLLLGRDVIALPVVAERFSVTKTVMGSLETPARPREVLGLMICPGSAAISGKTLSAEMEVTVLYTTENGVLAAVQRAIRAETEHDLTGMENREAAALLEGEAYAGIVGSGFEVRFPVCMSAFSSDDRGLETISSIAWDPEQPRDTADIPSLTVYRTRGGDDLWELGKQFCSTDDLILRANGLEGNAPLAAGIMLVIPKKR